MRFRNLNWRNFILNGYIATAIVSLAVLLISLCSHIGLRYCLAFLPAIYFSGIQVARIWMVRKSINGTSLVYGYASALAEQRTSGVSPNDKQGNTEWREDLVETYRHQREHGNSGFIFLLELALAGLAYWIVANDDLSDPLKKLSAVGILFGLWAFPAALVHQLAQHLERSFSLYAPKDKAGDIADSAND